MSKSSSPKGTTLRSYPMSERSRALMDQMSIILPGYTKADLMNFYVYWFATCIKMRQDESGCDAREAVEAMRAQMKEFGYDAIRDNLSESMAVTELDRLFED